MVSQNRTQGRCAQIEDRCIFTFTQYKIFHTHYLGWYTQGQSGRVDNCDVSEGVKRYMFINYQLLVRNGNMIKSTLPSVHSAERSLLIFTSFSNSKSRFSPCLKCVSCATNSVVCSCSCAVQWNPLICSWPSACTCIGKLLYIYVKEHRKYWAMSVHLEAWHLDLLFTSLLDEVTYLQNSRWRESAR